MYFLLLAALSLAFPESGLRDSELVCLYDQSYYEGKRTCFSTAGIKKKLPGFNDKASSIRIAKGCKVEARENRNMRGREMIVNSNLPIFPKSFDKRMSSLEITC